MAQQQLTNEQRQVLAKQRISVEVNPFEREIVLEMRKHKFGRIIVHLLDGVPYRYELGVSHLLFGGDEGGNYDENQS